MSRGHDAIRSYRLVGIETSCDETAVALIDSAWQGDQPQGAPLILADEIQSQIDAHQPYGGVVPEIAARAHLAHLPALVDRALERAGIALGSIDAVAATAGPGLIGGVIVGLTFAKALAFGLDKPLIGVNHLEAHALTARISPGLTFPFLLLLVSGGHCQFLYVAAFGQYHRLGTTIDDAPGEAFDKAAKSLGLPYPGGPAIEALALSGDGARFALPRPLLGRSGCDFSFSGLKTALRQEIARLGPVSAQDRADLAASFQQAVGDCLADRAAHALDLVRQRFAKTGHLVVAGGVAANRYLRARLERVAADHGHQLIAPPGRWCTDNAVMIAWAGAEHLARGQWDDLSVPARPRWPLDPDALGPAPNRAAARARMP